MIAEQTLQQELAWIKLVREQNNSQALECLVQKYLPLIESTSQKYRLRLFDRDDWRQEARIVCLETCQIFDERQGSRFGSFYKLRLQNHWTNLVRQQLALKRQTNVNAVSMEALEQANPELENDLCWQLTTFKNEVEFLSTEFPQMLQQLSLVELKGLRFLLGTDLEQVTRHSAYSKTQILQASQRSRLKFLAFYQRLGLDTPS